MTTYKNIVAELKRAEENGSLNQQEKKKSKEKQSASNSTKVELTQQRLLDTIHTQVWFLTDDHTYGAVNNAHARFNGCEKEDLEFRDMYDIFPKEVVDVCREGNKEVFKSKKPIVSNEWVPHHSGEQRLIRIFKNPIINQHGNVDYVVCSAEDITEIKKAEDAAQDSEQNFRTFFETIDDLMIIGSPDGNIIFTNSAVSQKLGYSSEELKTTNILDLHPPQYKKEAEMILNEMFQGKRKFCPLPLQKKDGTFLPVETRVWFGKWDKKECIFGISKDLSKQQAALDKFHKLFDNNPALMAMSRIPNKCFVEVNDAFLKKLGYSKEEVLGKTSEDLNLFVEPEKQKEIAKKLAETGTIRDIELDVRKKDGTIITGLFSGDVIDNQVEKNFLTVMTDITPQKKAKKELHEQINALQRYKKVTIDREMKMTELKKENEKLKKELSKSQY